MRYIRLYENFDGFVGIHCGNVGEDDDFRGPISEEYYSLFPQLLAEIRPDFPGAQKLIDKIDELPDGLWDESDEAYELRSEIWSFLDDNDLEWIFVSKKEALTKYGERCYSVHFDDMRGVYMIQDELVDDAEIYVFTPDRRPRLEPYY